MNNYAKKFCLKILLGVFFVFAGYVACDAVSYYTGHGTRIGYLMYKYFPAAFESDFLSNTPWGATRIKFHG